MEAGALFSCKYGYNHAQNFMLKCIYELTACGTTALGAAKLLMALTLSHFLPNATRLAGGSVLIRFVVS